MSSNNNSRGSSFRARGKYWRGRGNFRGNFYKKRRNDSTSNVSTNSGNIHRNTDPHPGSSGAKPTQISIDSFYDHIPGRYKAWRLYFPLEEYNTASPTVNKMKTVEKFIREHRESFNITEIEDKKSFHIDLKDLLGNCGFVSDWPNFQDELITNPDHTLNCLSLSMHQHILDELENHVTQNGGKGTDISLPIIRARLLNFGPSMQLKDLAANIYGKLVSVKGTVIRVGNIKLLCTWLAFSCNRCNKIQCVQQPEGCYSLPTSCTTQSCLSRTFTPLCSSGYTQTVNWQTIKIQEIITDDQVDGGRVPRTVECELVEELVDSCLPGDVVTITGIVKIQNSDGYMKKSKSPSVFNIYIEGKSVSSNKNYSSAGGNARQTIDVEFTTDDYYSIREIHSRSRLFKLFVNSLCPSIYGHEMIKAGLLLGLVGGAQGSNSRGDSHILIVGDPGLGKSQMLQACAMIAPRGVYVCGNTSSTSGLTVTLTREAGGNYALEAGALVLADQGCCCIDEFDKMSNQHQALLEAMEQQVISISKAGVICTLPARTSILAAANPVSGHYTQAKSVAENLRLGSALLSRFDLVFILQDQPNERLDSLLSEHVMALYSGLKNSSECESDYGGEGSSNQIFTAQNIPLSDSLKLQPGDNVNLVPASMLRKYIAYAKKYVPNPRLSLGAAQILQCFYLELRRQHHTLDATPITNRQLESLIRLTQARAKLELREEATVFDAVEVVELMRWSMVDTFSDSFGGLDFKRSQHGSGMSSKNKAKVFISALQRVADAQGRSTFDVNYMKDVAKQNNIIVSDFFEFVCSLNNQGFLLKKGKNLYQLMSVDY